MQRLSDSLVAYYRDFTAAAVKEGLTSTQANTLGVLSRGTATMRELATALSCDASNVTGVVDRLERRGLVNREPSPTDRRVKHVLLTDEGRRAITTVRDSMLHTQQGLASLEAADRDALYELLGRAFPQRAEG
ncbi:MarR family transcriptional regulator [Streptomyces sp. NA04227]|nr:MarR family transcriptional regulator [Streptomyces sp. NA04227]